MAMINYSSVPTHPYDIQPNDFPDQYYQAPSNGTFGMGPGESFYRPSLYEMQGNIFLSPHPFERSNNLSDLYPPHPELEPTFIPDQVMYNGGVPFNFQSYNAVVPNFQTQPSFTVLSPTPGSLTSLQGALTLSPASLRKKVQKANPKSKEKGKGATRSATQSAKKGLIGQPKRKRGPNKWRSDTSFSYMLVGLFPLLSDNEK